MTIGSIENLSIPENYDLRILFEDHVLIKYFLDYMGLIKLVSIFS